MKNIEDGNVYVYHDGAHAAAEAWQNQNELEGRPTRVVSTEWPRWTEFACAGIAIVIGFSVVYLAIRFAIG